MRRALLQLHITIISNDKCVNLESKLHLLTSPLLNGCSPPRPDYWTKLQSWDIHSEGRETVPQVRSC